MAFRGDSETLNASENGALLEVGVAAFMLSGCFDKSLALFGWSLPIPAVLLSAVVVLVGAFWSERHREMGQSLRWLATRRSLFLCLLFIALFFVWAIARAIPNGFSEHEVHKLLGLGTGLFILMVSILRTINTAKVMQWVLWIAVGASVLNLVGTHLYRHFEHYLDVKDAYLYLSHVLGIALLYFWFAPNAFGRIERSHLPSFMFMGLTVLALLNARFTAVFVGGVWLVDWSLAVASMGRSRSMAISGRRATMSELKGLALTAIALGSLLTWLYLEESALMIRALDRAELLKDGMAGAGFGKSIGSRLDWWAFGIQEIFGNWRTFLIGDGWASFGLAMGGAAENYPHNLLIELWFETGILGVLLFFAPWVIAVRKKGKVNIPNWLWVLLIFEWLTLMKSHSLADTRWLFLLLGWFLIQTFGERASDATSKMPQRELNADK